jgi:Fic family protein
MNIHQLIKKIDLMQAQINEHRPLDRATVKAIREYYRIGLTYASNALEGNSLTISETKVILEDGLTIGGKPLKHHFEAVGHSEAYEHMYSLAKGKEFTEADIKKLHQLFYYRISQKDAGRYRRRQVYISGSDYPLPAPEEVPLMMKAFVDELPELRESLHPVELAARVHKKSVCIHPFIDGNGRVARLLMNLVLIQTGYVLAVIPPVLRGEYIMTIQAAHKDDSAFIKFIAEALCETQQDYMRMFIKGGG